MLWPSPCTQGCFYHLTQSTWGKIQDLDLTNHYKEWGLSSILWADQLIGISTSRCSSRNAVTVGKMSWWGSSLAKVLRPNVCFWCMCSEVKLPARHSNSKPSAHSNKISIRTLECTLCYHEWLSQNQQSMWRTEQQMLPSCWLSALIHLETYKNYSDGRYCCEWSDSKELSW